MNSTSPGAAQGPKYWVDIEGEKYEWTRATITAREVAELGVWDISKGVILIDADNTEHQLEPDESIELKPGMGFAKKVRFKRG